MILVTPFNTEVYELADKLKEIGLSSVQVKGTEVMAACPYHEEQTVGAFFVNPDNGFICHSCKKSGSIDKFFKDLSKKMGVKITYEVSEENVFSFLDYEVQDETPPDLNPRVIDTYIDDPSYFRKEWGISEEVANNRRLVIDPDSRAECFPIFDYSFKFRGFVERWPGIPRSTIKYPKGLDRNRILIGAVLPEEARSQSQPFYGEIWVTEGVRDLCGLESKLGVRAVALGGCYASAYQISLLKRYNKVVLALDNDEAGKAGVERIKDRMEVSTAEYIGKDPLEGQNFKVKDPEPLEIFKL